MRVEKGVGVLGPGCVRGPGMVGEDQGGLKRAREC